MLKKVVILICIIVIILITGWLLLKLMGVELGDIQGLQVEKIVSEKDYNNNGMPDSEEFMIGARKDVANGARYISEYYDGGYPPDNKGVCVDVIWRAFQEAGYSLKDMVDKDIKERLGSYPRVNGKPDPNIDFRRVPNLVAFFDKHAKQLTLEIIACN